jgi:hypothetical protein
MALSQPWAQVIGPPGTGKTTTGVYMLNAMDMAIRVERDWLASTTHGVIAGLPHLAVAAPSNEAADGLLWRVMAQGFGTGIPNVRYTPLVCRVGNTGNMHPAFARDPLVNVRLAVKDVTSLKWDARGQQHKKWEEKVAKEVRELI